jgi:hypothetical protein
LREPKIVLIDPQTEEPAMAIRAYQPGDEQAQTDIYNAAAGSLPGFKPTTAAEIARRYSGAPPDSGSRFFAVDNGQVVGYATFGLSGRISAPWCLPGAEAYREPLLETVLTAMRQRGLSKAWAAYRGNWDPALDFLRARDFIEERAMINYVAEMSSLPAPSRIPSNRVIEPLNRDELPQLIALAPGLFIDTDRPALEQFFWSNPFYAFPDSLFVLKDSESKQVQGAFLVVLSDRFADPTKIDAAMPCFRLGAFGTERERHKRVNGLFSCAFADEAEGNLLLSAALESLTVHSVVTHIAAQAPTDAVSLCHWYDHFFQRQGSFPILSRRLTG